MLRAYALGMGAGTQGAHPFAVVHFVRGRPGEGSRAVLMGLAWILNAVVAEYVIRTRVTTNGGTTSRRARPVLLSTTLRSVT
jgi:hypothetical protein